MVPFMGLFGDLLSLLGHLRGFLGTSELAPKLGLSPFLGDLILGLKGDLWGYRGPYDVLIGDIWDYVGP